MHKLVLIRHGESTWNLENRFTGWTDVDLTPLGLEQAKESGRLLKAEGYDFDVCYTSVLKRATRTLWHVLDEMDRTWLPVANNWRLNEFRLNEFWYNGRSARRYIYRQHDCRRIYGQRLWPSPELLRRRDWPLGRCNG